MRNSLIHPFLAEFIGTFILVFFGVGAVHTAVLTGAQVGIGQVAVVWGIAVSLAVYALGAQSGAHLNPAITLALAAWRDFPMRQVIPYILAQLLGAIAAAAILYLLFHGFLIYFESAHQIVRGAAGSELSAQIYGEYFPNPGIRAGVKAADAVVSLPIAMLAEAIGTAFLAFFIFALTDRRNERRPKGVMTAVGIGLAVTLIISIIAPLTQAGLNPARDFGPRLFSYFAGWGKIAIPGPRGGFFTVYILSPILGALAGGAVYEFLIKIAMAKTSAIKIQEKTEALEKELVS